MLRSPPQQRELLDSGRGRGVLGIGFSSSKSGPEFTSSVYLFFPSEGAGRESIQPGAAGRAERQTILWPTGLCSLLWSRSVEYAHLLYATTLHTSRTYIGVCLPLETDVAVQDGSLSSRRGTR